MELQDTGSEMLNGTIWLGQSPSTPYQRLSSSDQQDERNVIIGEQVSMGYHVSDGIILWQENKEMPKNDHQLHTNDDISRGNSPTLEPPVSGYHHSTLNGLKRPLNENHQTIGELERKYIRRDESAGSNVSVQGWSSGQVEELAEHLVADFDGSLSSLAVTDLATAVASYNMSEALLTLPSTLNVCKQEAPSPENHIDNSNLNQVSQRNTTSVRQNISDNVQSVEPDSNHDGNNVVNNDSTITAIGSKSSAINHRNVKNNVNDVGNNTNEIVNNDRRTSEAAASFQFLYSNNDDYPTASSTGNHVSSSQQGIEFNEDSRFQYVLAAATSIATKINEETLTYLNQGQSYEIKLKKLGDLSAYRGKILKSTIRICFHDRRLQYTEREQILSWQRARPGERLLEVDIPLSYGVLDIVQSSSKSSVEFMWDPTKEVGVYIKVNCISTEFTPKKHGGEKGVPFKINVETLLPGGPRLHAASCQIKVFKLKGADRKHKQDRDKILRRPSHEQEKYQPSYDCTVLSDIPLDSLSPFTLMSQTETNPTISHDAIAPQIPVNIPEGSSPLSAVNSPVSESSSEDSTTIMPTSSNDPYRSFVGSHPPPKNRNIQEAAAWLRKYFPAHESTFVNYSGIDLLNLTRQELIQFCGPLDGIRMYNEIIEKAPVPKLVIYCALEVDEQPIWKIIRLFEKTSDALTEKLSTVFNLPKDRLHSILFQGPRGIHVLICNDLVSYMEKDSVYLVQILKDSPVGYFKLLLKPYDG